MTPEAVIDAALRVIDDEGLDALTMRRLAHDLGVEPVTIYRQLPNKEAILAGVAEKLWREMAPPDAAAPPAGEAPSPPSPGLATGASRCAAMWLALNEPDAAAPQRDPDHRPRRHLLAQRRRGHRRDDAGVQATPGSRPTRRPSCCTSSRPAWSASGSRTSGAGRSPPRRRQPPRRSGRAGASGRGLLGRRACGGRPTPADDLADYREAIAKLGPGAVRRGPRHRAGRVRRRRRATDTCCACGFESRLSGGRSPTASRRPGRRPACPPAP